MVVDAAILQTVSTLHIDVTMLSVWQEHTASLCDDAYSAMESIAAHSFTFGGSSVCSCRCCVAIITLSL